MSFARNVKSMSMGMPVNSAKPMPTGMKMGPAMKAAAGEPDADERGAASDKDADDSMNQLRHSMQHLKQGNLGHAKKHALNAANLIHKKTGTGDL